jgi:hypothetical protein
MAEKTKTPRAKRAVKPRKRQTALPGFEEPRHPLIEKAARKFLDCRDERFDLIKQYADAKLNLVAAMKEHGVSHYEFDGFAVDLDESQSVKVKKKKAPVESNGDGEADEE